MQRAFFTGNTRPEVEEVSRIYHGLCSKRKAKIGKTLRHEHTQARVVDRKPALERIDRKDGSLG